MNTDKHLIEPEALALMLDNPDLVILEAGFSLPGMTDSLVGLQHQTIRNARIFDVERIADHSNPLPHMVPTAADFAAAVGALGVKNSSLVVCYDRFGLFSAGRVWWMFRLFGHQRVVILNGGMVRWMQLHLPVQDMDTSQPEPTLYTAEFDAALYATKVNVLEAIDDANATIVDARPPSRFAGLGAEPRAGMRAGHMPSALNVCYQDLVDPKTGMLQSAEVLRDLYAKVPAETDVTYSCGSGITAAALLFVGEMLGIKGRVYDGSWSEWGSLPDTPIVKED